MIFLLGLLLVAGLAVAAVAALARLALGRRAEGEGLLGGAGALMALAGAGVVVLFLAVTLFGVIGVRGGSGGHGTSDEEPAGPRPAPRRDPVATTAPPSTVPERGRPVSEPGVPPGLGPVVSLHVDQPHEATFRRPAPAVGGLEPGTVLRLSVAGFPPFATARARQCVEDRALVCGNALGVHLGPEGRASFQYLVTDDFAPTTGGGRCRARAAPCSIVVEAVDDEARAAVRTVFHDDLGPPPRVRVSPRADLADGRSVTVQVAGFRPGERLRAVLCAAPDIGGTRRCGPPGPSTALTVGPDGTASAGLAIRTGPVGSDRVRCGRGRTCGVSVVSELGTAAAPPVPVTFAARSGAHYDAGRLGAGIAAAVALLGLAGWLIRRTDWSPIGEEAAPEIDEAEYADLDAIIAALPPEEDDIEEALRGPGRG